MNSMFGVINSRNSEAGTTNIPAVLTACVVALLAAAGCSADTSGGSPKEYCHAGVCSSPRGTGGTGGRRTGTGGSVVTAAGGHIEPPGRDATAPDATPGAGGTGAV